MLSLVREEFTLAMGAAQAGLPIPTNGKRPHTGPGPVLVDADVDLARYHTRA